MKKNAYLYRTLAVLTVGIALCMSGCGKKSKISYGDIPGVATGKIDLSGDKAVLEIDNIKSEVGEDIDYTSRLDVIDGGGSYTVDVNASNVKYDTPGTYNVGYTVRSDRGTYTSNVKVTVTDEKGASKSGGDDSQNYDINNGGDVNHSPENYGDSASGQDGNEGYQGAASPQQANVPQENGGQANNGQQGNGQAGDNGQGNQQANQPGNSGNNSQNGQNPDTRVLIPGDSNTTYKTKNIENAVIELLSGDVVTISCSTSKYIVETKTEVSTVMRNGHNYEVSKLVVIFNTGAQRTLETVEKKID